jgi:hypothetical protein
LKRKNKQGLRLHKWNYICYHRQSIKIPNKFLSITASVYALHLSPFKVQEIYDIVKEGEFLKPVEFVWMLVIRKKGGRGLTPMLKTSSTTSRSQIQIIKKDCTGFIREKGGSFRCARVCTYRINHLGGGPVVRTWD